jgi:UDP-N-acetylglucosamine--N-acetylmuramyl-(pentapeptide) pyrophosphoryl-undecaprenol N-acetylglucosamine transferase
LKIVIAGGGTGGHLFPGIALAEEVASRAPQNQVVFVGTRRGIEVREVPRAGFPLEVIDVTGIRGKGLRGLLGGMARLPRALWSSLRLLRRHRPDLVVGVGGYASGPVLVAAWLLRIPTAIQEQNAEPGVTNRLLGWIVDAVFTAFPETATYFARRKVHLLGNPIRRTLVDNFLASPPVASARFSLLVFGGSQGAHRLNTALLEAMPLLPADRRGRLSILHQTGPVDRELVAQGYAQLGVEAQVLAFIDDMAAAYRVADLVICRAGATTLAELTVCKRPSLLVPFPQATGDHQTRNAAALVAAGAARMIPQRELDGPRLARELGELQDAPEVRARMALQAGRLGRPQAAREIADLCAELAGHGAPLAPPGLRARVER